MPKKHSVLHSSRSPQEYTNLNTHLRKIHVYSSDRCLHSIHSSFNLAFGNLGIPSFHSQLTPTHNHGGFPSPPATLIMETFHFRPPPETLVDHKSRAAVDTVTPPRPSCPAHASSYRSPTNQALSVNVLNAGWVAIGSVPITQVITWADRVLTFVVPR